MLQGVPVDIGCASREALALGKCRCGEQLFAYYGYSPFSYVESYCPKRKIYNFWKHDKRELLTFYHCPVVAEGGGRPYVPVKN